MLLRQMKYFLAAVYCKSFNEAAKQCFISQPSFSLQIKQLEKELGVKLINRNNCQFSLTPAGEEFYGPCKRIVGDVQGLLQNMQRFADKEQLPRYIIGCKTGYNVSRLLNIINRLNKNADTYHLEIVYGDHQQLMLMLKNKEVDMVVSESRTEEEGFWNEEIIEIAALYVCLPRNTSFDDAQYVEISALQQQTCVVVAAREFAEHEQAYYAQFLGLQGNFYIAKDIPTALTKVIDAQCRAFMPITNNSDATLYFHDFTKLLPLVKNKESIEIEYKIYWSKDSKSKLTTVVQHIVSMLLDH